jgi:hypothetical protein
VALRGAIIAESLLVGFMLQQVPLTVTRLSRTAIIDPARFPTDRLDPP